MSTTFFCFGLILRRVCSCFSVCWTLCARPSALRWRKKEEYFLTERRVSQPCFSSSKIGLSLSCAQPAQPAHSPSGPHASARAKWWAQRSATSTTSWRRDQPLLEERRKKVAALHVVWMSILVRNDGSYHIISYFCEFSVAQSIEDRVAKRVI